ncbi:hypothetical protein LLH03_20880, partial [bacterium]|nr:hypothetical protein [bacterium]
MAKKEVKDAPTKVITTQEKRKLKCELTRDELLDFGQKLADAQQRKVETEAELQSFKDQCKGKLATAEGDVIQFSSLIRQRYQHRDVECEVTKDYAAATVTVRRLDTFDTVETRPMTKDELAQ